MTPHSTSESKSLRIWLVVVVVGLTCSVQAEDVTVTTYYPSPRGNYQTLNSTGNTNLATAGGNVGIGTASITSPAKLQIDGDGSTVYLPRKSTAGDPTGSNGMIYYNANTNKFRCYQNGAWTDCAGGAIPWPLLAPDGSVGAPSYSFTNDSDMGIYRGGTDILRFSTAGLDRLTINASGSVGVGTTGPNEQLELYRNQASSRGSFLRLSSNGGGGTATGIGFMPWNGRSGGASAEIRGVDDGGAGAHLTFSTINDGSSATVERLRIQSDGNVGIGTTGPAAKLHILQTGGADALRVDDEAGDASPFVITSEGRVGLGIANPAFLYHMVLTDGPSFYTFRVDDEPNDQSGFGVHGDGNVYIGYDPNPFTAAKLSISQEKFGIAYNRLGVYGANGATPFVIDNFGNVGIGPGDPTAALTIRGTDKDWSPDVAGVQIHADTGAPGIELAGSVNATPYIDFHRQARNIDYDARIILSDFDRFDIDGANLFVWGSQVCTTAGCPAPSDIRLKKDVRTIDRALEKLVQLRGVTFEWKEPEKQGNLTGTQMGVIAQEVEKVFPQWVGSDDKGYKNVAFRGFEGLTIEAVKELHAEVQALKADNEALKRQSEALKQRVEALERERPR